MNSEVSRRKLFQFLRLELSVNPLSLGYYYVIEELETQNQSDSNKNKSPSEVEQIKPFAKSKTCNELEQKTPPAENQTNETLYLCNFRVSVDGDWLCLKELEEDTHQVDKNKETTNDIAVKRHAQHMTSSFLTPTLDKSINYPNYPTSKKGAIE